MLVDRVVNSEEFTVAFKERNGIEPFPLACFINDRGIPLFFHGESWYAPVEKDDTASQYKWIAYPFLNS